MSTRRAKQLLYGTLYLIIVLLVVWGTYALFIKPVFFSGPVAICSNQCLASSTMPIVAEGPVSLFITSPGQYTLLAQIVNPNAGFFSPDFNYSFDLFDASGTLLGALPAQSFIYENQTKYIVLANETLPTNVDHATFVVNGVDWTPVTAIDTAPQFTFENIQNGISRTTVSVAGEIANNDIASFDDVAVVAVFNGPDGTPIGASATEIDSISAESTANFSVLYPALPGIDPATSQLFAYALR